MQIILIKLHEKYDLYYQNFNLLYDSVHNLDIFTQFTYISNYYMSEHIIISILAEEVAQFEDEERNVFYILSYRISFLSQPSS